MWNDIKTRVLSAMVAVKVREEGQALVEYGLILGLIAVVCVAALTALGLGVEGLLNEIVEGL
jgi:pilus assembly protein Flp/PilA